MTKGGPNVTGVERTYKFENGKLSYEVLVQVDGGEFKK